MVAGVRYIVLPHGWLGAAETYGRATGQRLRHRSQIRWVMKEPTQNAAGIIQVRGSQAAHHEILENQAI